jgi:hypothetical protein
MRIQGGTDSIFALLAARQSSAAPGDKASDQTAAATAGTGEVPVAAPAEDSPDFTQMTPREMKDYAQQLWESGEIDLTQLFMLQTAGMPLCRPGDNGELIPLTNDETNAFQSQPANYFQVAQDAKEYIEYTGKQHDPTSGYANWKGIVEALKRATSGVDVVG